MTGLFVPGGAHRALQRTRKRFEIYQRFPPLMLHEHQGGLAVRKTIYKLRGLISHAHVRSPGPVLDHPEETRLTDLVRKFASEDVRFPC